MTENNNLSTSQIILSSSKMKFAAGHFTIFSEEKREKLHGHNFTLRCTLDVIGTEVENNGMPFDYGYHKDILSSICESVDETMLLPKLSQYLDITQRNSEVICWFKEKRMIFPKDDVSLLPVSNTTVEALSEWILNKYFLLISEEDKKRIRSIEMMLSSSSSQSGVAIWNKSN